MSDWNMTRIKGGDYLISPAELDVFIRRYDALRGKERNPQHWKILQIARGAVGSSIPGVFTEEQIRDFKVLESELLGLDWTIAETFREQMGIASEGTKAEKGELKFDLAAHRGLLASWNGKKQAMVIEQFHLLEPYEQKLLLKAFAHFSQTDAPMKVAPGLSSKDLQVLQSLVEEKLQKNAGSVGSYPREGKMLSKQFFTWLYPVYKGVETLPEQKGQKPSFSKKQELYEKGEKGIGNELKNDFLHLSRALPRLRERFEQGDLTVEADIKRFYGLSQLAIVKAETLVALYQAYNQDPDILFLHAKASLHLLALKNMGIKPHGSQKELVEFHDYLLTDDFLKLNPKAPILASQCARLQAPLTKETFQSLNKALRHAIEWGDQEALIEQVKLYTAAWKEGFEGVKEEEILELLKPLGKAGAGALREFFQKGSLEAGKALVRLLEKKGEPETIKEKIQRAWQSILSLVLMGPAALFTEKPFLSKDRNKFSSEEIDFLIEAALLGVEGAKELMKKSLAGDFGPKIPLEQAHSFIEYLRRSWGEHQLDDQDPYLIINRKEIFRHIEAAKAIAGARTFPLLEAYSRRAL